VVQDLNLYGNADIAMTKRTKSFTIYNGSHAVFLRTENDFDADGMTNLVFFLPE
jgi:hypothetical protein